VPPTRVSLSFALKRGCSLAGRKRPAERWTSESAYTLRRALFLGVGGSCAIRWISIKGHSMLLTSTQVVPQSQHLDEPSVVLLHKIEELNKNTALLITEAGKLIQESKQLSERIRSFEHFSTKPKPPPPSSHY
jgi:hypothetical protein